MKFLQTVLILGIVFICGFAPARAQSERIFYEEPTLRNFSQLYWLLGRLNLEDQGAIDNFLVINECDLYKAYYNHEFEWRKVMDSAVKFIENNKKSFPLRFEFTEPLRLGEYNIETQNFNILEDYRIEGTRRFEIRTSDSNEAICGIEVGIEGYPRGIILELNRPFLLEKFSVQPEIANQYISQKLPEVGESTSRRKTREHVYEERDAYLVLKVKIFSSDGDERTSDGQWLAHVYGILEAMEIYADREKTQLLFAQDYLAQRRNTDGIKPELRAQFERAKHERALKVFDMLGSDVVEEKEEDVKTQ